MSAAARNSGKIRVAVVGAGEFGRNHARVYREMPDVEFAGVYDRDAERTARVAQEFGTRAFSSLEELRGQVDAVSVAVPTIEHAQVGCRLLEAGLDILVEKPMATDVSEADRLINSASRHKRILLYKLRKQILFSRMKLLR